jgi:phospholipid/cholesterol/gamma-HCH transport system substrate-binding protein
MSATTSRAKLARAALPLALAAAVGVLVVILLSRGSYTLHAHFQYASQLVKGGEVKIAGRRVGTVSRIALTPDGQADVTLSVGDRAITPLHAGTRASIRALGQAGIANHFVDLAPGPASAARLPSGTTLSTEQTSSMVDLDAILDSFGPAQRLDLQRLITSSDKVFAGSGSGYFNQLLGRLDPALAQINGLTGELATDRVAIKQVINEGAVATRTLASRSSDLMSAVSNTARSLGAIARERASLADLLSRAPGVLSDARGTLAHAAGTLTALHPVLRGAVPTAAPLHEFLRRVKSTLRAATPAVAQLGDELPGLRASLAGLRPLAPLAVPALHSAGKALADARHIVRGARFYGADLVLGILDGLVGAGSYNYSRWGHYERLDFIQPPQTALGGSGNNLLTNGPLLPGIIDIKTQLLRRCPGGNVPPAVDGSTPWIPDPSLCTPSQDIPASVNQP